MRSEKQKEELYDILREIEYHAMELNSIKQHLEEVRCKDEASKLDTIIGKLYNIDRALFEKVSS